MKQKELFFWNFLAFSVIQRRLAIWSLVPLPFLNQAWTSGSSLFMYCWSLAWRILSITLLAMWNECNCAVVWTFLCHCPSLGLEWKPIFSSPVAAAEFSKFAGRLIAALSTASSFRIWNSSTGIQSPPLALFVVMLSKAQLTSHPRCLVLDEWSHHHDYLGREDLFCTVLPCILATSS